MRGNEWVEVGTYDLNRNEWMKTDPHEWRRNLSVEIFETESVSGSFKISHAILEAKI